MGATPTPTATSSGAPRAVTLALGVPGSGTQLIINDDAGLSAELRQAIAEAVGLDPARVSITAVQVQELAANGTLVSSGAAIALNATVAANNGTLSQSNASLVWASPTAQPVSAPARRVLLAADAACVTHRSFNPSGGSRTSISLALDMSGRAWVNHTDPADRIADLLARSLDAPSALRNFSHAWTECTGADSSAGVIQVLQAPAVRTGTRPSPSQPATAALAASGAHHEFSGLGKGGLAAVLVVLLFSACAYCCCVCALCVGARRRHKQQQEEEKKQEAADKVERGEVMVSAPSSPRDLTIAAISGAVFRSQPAAAPADLIV